MSGTGLGTGLNFAGKRKIKSLKKATVWYQNNKFEIRYYDHPCRQDSQTCERIVRELRGPMICEL